MIVARTIGTWMGVCFLTVVTVVLQAVAAILLSGDRGAPWLGGFGHLLVSLLLYSLVLVAWSRTLCICLRPSAALLCLLVLVFTGFLLPGLADRYPGLEPLVALVPDLGVIAPVRAVELTRAFSTRHILYVVLQAAMAVAGGAVILRILRDRGRRVES